MELGLSIGIAAGVLLAAFGVLAPATFGRAVLCIESDGRVTIERPVLDGECDSACAPEVDDAPRVAAPAPHDCVDLEFSTATAHLTASGKVLASPVVLAAAPVARFEHSPLPTAHGAEPRAPALTAVQQSIRAIVLRL